MSLKNESSANKIYVSGLLVPKYARLVYSHCADASEGKIIQAPPHVGIKENLPKEVFED